MAVSVALFDSPSFLGRRLVSSFGLFALGLFWAGVFATLKTIWVGVDSVHPAIISVHSSPWRLVLETVFIYAPLGFWAVQGIGFFLSGRDNVHLYPAFSNFRYFLTRAGGFFTAAFIVGYFFLIEKPAHFGGIKGQFFIHIRSALSQGIWAAALVVGVMALLHFALSLWNFFLDWGIAASAASRKILWRICFAAFLFAGAFYASLVMEWAA